MNATTVVNRLQSAIDQDRPYPEDPQAPADVDQDKGGVVGARCGCCDKVKFVENRDAWERRQESGEAVFCSECLALPEAEAERMILQREADNDPRS